MKGYGESVQWCIPLLYHRQEARSCTKHFWGGKCVLSSPQSQRLGGRNDFSMLREVDVVDSLSLELFRSRLALLKPYLYGR